MHPAKSVIFFTTASGAGYGLIVWLGVLAALGHLPTEKTLGIAGIGLALFLIIAGLLSSTLHLGHPERAWRAFSQWKSSWLSREGVAAIVTFIPIILFGYYWLAHNQPPGLVGLLAATASLVTVYCTAMIYASLGAVPAWSTPWTPVGYLVMSLTTGGALIVFLTTLLTSALFQLCAVLVTLLFAICIIVKLLYWRRIDTAPARSTAQSATGLDKFGTVRLIEAPHSQSNYLMEEMGFAIARKHATKLRKISLIGGFIIPAMLTTIIAAHGPAPIFLSFLACLLVGVGVSVERWLFFGEARHAVTLYYGANAV